MRFLTSLLLTILSLEAVAQNNELLRSRGTLPKNITGTAQQIASYEIQKRESRHDTIQADEFRLINNTADLCERIVQSGRLLINDSMSAYTNRILDTLLQDDLALRKELCAFCSNGYQKPIHIATMLLY